MFGVLPFLVDTQDPSRFHRLNLNLNFLPICQPLTMVFVQFHEKLLSPKPVPVTEQSSLFVTIVKFFHV